MRASAQFDDSGFVNTWPSSAEPVVPRPAATLACLWGDPARRPARRLPAMDPRGRWLHGAETGLRVTWLGHSTALVEVDGVRVLTDPVWSARISPLSFAGPKRFQPVPVDIDDLPAIDVALISHDHYDHLDRASVLALAALRVPFVMPLGVGMHLEAWGVRASQITELDWWESAVLPGGMTITATPAHHSSGRALLDGNATLWSSFVLRGDRHAVFFSGDTGLTPVFDRIGRRLGPFDLVMLEVGAFHPSWGDMHLGPHRALQAWAALGSGRLLPVHWGTFDLALHAWHEPAEALFAHAPPGLLMPLLGEPVEPGRVEDVVPWWREPAAALRRFRMA